MLRDNDQTSRQSHDLRSGDVKEEESTHVRQRHVKAERYRKILKKDKIAEFLKVGSREPFEFMEDGAPAHRAKSTRKWLDDQGIKRFEG